MRDREMTVRDVAVQAERRRVVGMLLAEVGRQRLAGNQEAARVLDTLALEVEHPDAMKVSA